MNVVLVEVWERVRYSGFFLCGFVLSVFRGVFFMFILTMGGSFFVFFL